jgi:hypothetical protein
MGRRDRRSQHRASGSRWLLFEALSPARRRQVAASLRCVAREAAAGRGRGAGGEDYLLPGLDAPCLYKLSRYLQLRS